MRKATIELIPNAEVRKVMDNILSKIQSIEAIQILKTDFDRGIRFGIGTCTLKDGVSLEELEKTGRVEIIDVIKAEANKYICFVKVKLPREYTMLMKKFELDLIWDTPTIISYERIVLSAIGDKDSLKRLLEATRILGEIKSIKYPQATFINYNILSCLTDRQREVVLEAKRSGYYDYPRRINGEHLAEKLGISKAATIEHLRKAEERIMSNILNGY